MQLKNAVNRKQVLLQCMQCAEACFGLLFDLAWRPAALQEMARKCLESCEACAATCEAYDSPELQRCAAACRHCARALRPLVMPFILN